jgi:hypothetical protein
LLLAAWGAGFTQVGGPSITEKMSPTLSTIRFEASDL